MAASPKADGVLGLPAEPPRNLEAEQQLLGSIFCHDLGLAKVVDFLRPEHFYEPLHQRIYTTMMAVSDKGQKVMPITLVSFFEADPAILELDKDRRPGSYLMRLAAHAHAPSMVEHYAKIVFEMWKRRELINAGRDLVAWANNMDPDDDAEEQLGRHMTVLEKIASGNPRAGLHSLSGGFHKAILGAENAIRNQGRVDGISTGLRALDNKIGALRPGRFVVIGGRPSMGKTTLAKTIAWNVARQKKAVAMFSLEMTDEEVAISSLAEATGISADRQSSGELDSHDFKRLQDAAAELSPMSFFIDDRAGLRVSDLRAQCRMFMRRGDLGLIVVDYLQLLRSDGKKENRVQEVSDISRGLKELAKETGVCVLALSQLSRAVEQREDKRPVLSDLRESGSIEQDADIIGLMYSEEYYLLREPPPVDASISEQADYQAALSACKGRVELNIAKQRLGPIGPVTLAFNGEASRFNDPFWGEDRGAA